MAGNNIRRELNDLRNILLTNVDNLASQFQTFQEELDDMKSDIESIRHSVTVRLEQFEAAEAKNNIPKRVTTIENWLYTNMRKFQHKTASEIGLLKHAINPGAPPKLPTLKRKLVGSGATRRKRRNYPR